MNHAEYLETIRIDRAQHDRCYMCGGERCAVAKLRSETLCLKHLDMANARSKRRAASKFRTHCARCKELGHNVRTCPVVLKERLSA